MEEGAPAINVVSLNPTDDSSDDEGGGYQGPVSFSLGTDGVPRVERLSEVKENELFDAVVNVGKGDKEFIAALNKPDCDISFKHPWFNHRNVLHELAVRGKNHLIALILEKEGAQIDIEDDRGSTPLLVAIESKVADTISLLVAQGADLLKLSKAGSAPLHELTFSGLVDVLKEIASKRKIDFNIEDDRGMTCLHYACFASIEDEAKQLELVQFLLDNGANVNGSTNAKVTPLQSSLNTYRDDVALVKLLCSRGADPNMIKPDTDAPLLKAISYNKPLCALALLEAGAKADARADSGLTAAHLACLAKLPEVLAILIEKGADINAKDSQGETPLFLLLSPCPPDREKPKSQQERYQEMWGDYAEAMRLQQEKLKKHEERVKKGKEGCWKLLLAHKVDIHVTTPELGQTAVFCAADDIEYLKALKELGANLEGKDTDGNTVLHFSVSVPSLECIQYLLDNGLSPNVQNDEGFSPLHVAVLRVIERPSPEEPAVKEHVSALLAKGADCNVKNKAGLTPLQLLLREKQELSQELLEANADVNCADNEGNTIMHDIVDTNFKGVAEPIFAFLLKKGIKTDVRNNAGKTPADVAGEAKNMGFTYLLRGQVLEAIREGIDVNKFECILGEKLKLSTQKFHPRFLSTAEIQSKWGLPGEAIPRSASLESVLFSFLDPIDLRSCALVCRQFRIWANNDVLWESLCLCTYGREASLRVSGQDAEELSWKQRFWIQYRIHQNWLKGRCTVKHIMNGMVEEAKQQDSKEEANEEESGKSIGHLHLDAKSGLLCAVGGSSVTVYDSTTMKQLHHWPIAGEDKMNIAVINGTDDVYIAVAPSYGHPTIYSHKQDKILHSLSSEEGTYAMCIAEWKGKLLAGYGGNEDKLVIWDVAKGEQLASQNIDPKSIYGWDIDGDLLVVGTGFQGDLNVRLFDLNDGCKLVQKYDGNKDPISSLAIDAATNSIVSFSGRQVIIYDITNGARGKFKVHSGLTPDFLEIDRVAKSRTAVSSSAGELFLWDVPAAQLKHKLSVADDGHQFGSYSAMEKCYSKAVYMSANGRALLVAVRRGGSDSGASGHLLDVFDVDVGTLLYSIKLPCPVSAIVAEGSLLVVGGHTGKLLAYDFQVL